MTRLDEHHQDSADTEIVLATLNARYIHAAFGLRYLKANLGELQENCVIEEFTLESRAEDIVESLLIHQPKIIGFGIYIWNVEQTTRVIGLLKAVDPLVKVVIGGPEVSYELDQQVIVSLADYVITGWGEKSFANLCSSLLQGEEISQKVISGIQPKLTDIKMPYALYNEQDIKNRVLYVEASRGCPFKCEFCLSALDKTAWPFDLDLFLAEMDRLYKRGARHFKFVDRTFNLKVNNSLRILEFFLERLDDDLFLHFEVIPDHLPEALKKMIARFPAGSMQFEIGIQTFNAQVQQQISRKQNNEKSQQNIRWIKEHSKVHVHADLIFGLPGETLNSFEDSFNQLIDLNPDEIQVGILKRLKGSPIIRHTQTHQLVFNPNPPFAIVSSDTVTYAQVQTINRFARYWDLIGNSGRFSSTLNLLIQDNPFKCFSIIADQLFARTGQTHKISLLRLYDLVFDIAVEHLAINKEQILQCIKNDFEQSGLKSIPKCLQELTGKSKNINQISKGAHRRRQVRHQR